MTVKTLGISLALIMVLSSCGGDAEETSRVPLPQVKTLVVEPGSEREFSITGEVTANQSASLKAEGKVSIQNILVKPGDQVFEGQILVQLSSDNIEASYSTAASALGNSSNNLQQTIQVAEQNVEIAKLALETARTNLENTLKNNTAQKKQAEEALQTARLTSSLSSSSASTGLETAEKNLEKTKELNSTSEESARTTLENTIQSGRATLQSALTASDQIVGISNLNKNANDAFENNLGALNTATKSVSEASVRIALEAFKNYNGDYNNALSIAKNTEDAIKKTLDLLNNSITGSTYSETTLNTNIASITAQLGSVRGFISSLTAAKTNLDQTLANNASRLVSAEQAVESARKALESTEQKVDNRSQAVINAEAAYQTSIRQLETTETQARKQLEQAELSYEAAQRSAELSRIGASGSLTNTQGNFEQAQISLDKLTIRAPFSGTIRDIPVSQGDEVLAGTNLVTVDNEGQLKIISYLTSDEISKIQVGDRVKIGQRSSDRISAIASSADPVTKKYKVEILHENPFLHPGDFVKLRFTKNNSSQSVSNTLYVPLVAVHVQADENFVWGIDKQNKTKKIPIEIGGISGNNVAILSGIKSGDTVIVNGGRNIKEEGVKVEIVE